MNILNGVLPVGIHLIMAWLKPAAAVPADRGSPAAPLPAFSVRRISVNPGILRRQLFQHLARRRVAATSTITMHGRLQAVNGPVPEGIIAPWL